MDITKCTGTNCLSRNQCKRYTAPDSHRQSYFATPPLQPDGTCEMYWGINQVSIMDEIRQAAIADELNEMIRRERQHERIIPTIK